MNKRLIFGAVLAVCVVVLGAGVYSQTQRGSQSAFMMPTVAQLPSVPPQDVAVLPTVADVQPTYTATATHPTLTAEPTANTANTADLIAAIPEPEVVPGQFIVSVDDPNDPALAAYLAAVGGEIETTIPQLNRVVIQVPEGAPEPDASLEAEPDFIAYAQAIIAPPNDPGYSNQWAHTTMNVPLAWQLLPTNLPDGPTVALIDSGVCLNHPDLLDRLLPGWDYVEDDDTPQDEYNHGCGIAGIIASPIGNGVGVAGMVPNTRILPLRVLNATGGGSYANIASALIKATDDGADIANLSLGGFGPSSTLQAAVDYADANGVTLVGAAGNYGGNYALYPAAYPNVISVGSHDEDGAISSFSNYGDEVDVYAPGGGVYILAPETTYREANGTSFAAPHITGAIILADMLGIDLTFEGNFTFDNFLEEPTPMPPMPLFTTVQTGASQGAARGEVRTRTVTVDTDAMFGVGALANEAAILNLFDDATYTTTTVSIGARALGREGTVWRAQLLGVDYSEVVFIITEENGNTQIEGYVRLPGQLFTLSPLAGEEHIIREIDETAYLASTTNIEVPQVDERDDVGAQTVNTADVNAQDLSTDVDIMVVYTAAARAQAGATIEQQIEGAVLAVNQSFVDSGVDTALDLVHMQQVTFTEAGDLETDLNRLIAISPDSQVQVINTLRDTHDADIVTIITASNDDGGCGDGFLLNIEATFMGDFAFNAVYADCLQGGLALGYSIGPNFGADNDPANGGGNGTYAYSNGYQDPTGEFSTMMALPTGGTCDPTCTPLLRWSNPLQTFNNKPLGDEETADNARTINSARRTVANFRIADETPCFETNVAVFPPDAGTATVSPPSNCPGGYLDGTTVTISATLTDSNNFEFLKWRGGVVGGLTEDGLEFEVDNDATYTAVFHPVNSGAAPNDNTPQVIDRTTDPQWVQYMHFTSRSLDDPNASCDFTFPTSHVFFEFVGDGEPLELDTRGSAIDTFVAVFTANTQTSLLEEVICDDDGGGDGTSALSIDTQVGREYLIMVGSERDVSGRLALNIGPERTVCDYNVPDGDTDLLVTIINMANNSNKRDRICLAENGAYYPTSATDNTLGASAFPAITGDVTIVGNSATIRRTGEGAFRFFIMDGEGSLTLEDLTLRNGLVTGGVDGGAVLVRGSGDFTARNVQFQDNTARSGGAVYANDSTGHNLFSNVGFYNNRASGAGGGLRADGRPIIVEDAVFYGNSANLGGGISTDTGLTSLYMRNVRVENNTATNEGGGLFVQATANYFEDVSLIGNQTDRGGGGAYINAYVEWFGGAVYGNNSSINGGGIMSLLGDNVFTDVSFFSNTSSGQGGGAARSANNRGVLDFYDGCFTGNDGNIYDDIYKSNAPLANAENIWWGTATGPDATAVNNQVDADPFSLVPIANCPTAETDVRTLLSVESVTTDGIITYSASVINDGPDPAPDTRLTIILPPEVDYYSAEAGAQSLSCTETAGVLTCDLGTVDNGTTEVISIEGVVGKVGDLTVEAFAMPYALETNQDNNSTTLNHTIQPVEQIVTNGDFASGAIGWSFVGNIDAEVVGGVLTAYRTNQNGVGSVSQVLGLTPNPATPLELTLDFANTSGVNQPVVVALQQIDGDEEIFCAFTVPAAQTALGTYRLRGLAPSAWTDTQLRLVFSGPAVPAVQVDHIVLVENATLNITEAECTTPPPPEDENLLANGTFDTDAHGWTPIGPIDPTWANGAYTLQRNGDGVAFVEQLIPYSLPTGAQFSFDLTMTGLIANANIVIALQDTASNAELFCPFTVPGDIVGPLPYALTGITDQAWSGVNVRIFINSAGVTIDDVDVRYIPEETLPAPLTCTEPDTPPDISLLTNGDFANGTTNWFVQGAVDFEVVGEQLTYTRTDTASFALASNLLHRPVPAGAPLQLTVDLGNSSNRPKNVTLALREFGGADEIFCLVTVPRDAPLQTYTLQGTTNQPWAKVDVFIFNDDLGTPDLIVDNVDVQYLPGASYPAVNCDKPTVPANTNLVVNSGFGAGETFWFFYGQQARDSSGGDLDMRRTDPASFALAAQPLRFDLPQAAPIEALVDFANPSSEPKHITLVVKNLAEPLGVADEVVCFFTVPPNTDAVTYAMEGITSEAWAGVDILLFVDDYEAPALSIDRVRVRYVPGEIITETVCIPPTLPTERNLVVNGEFTYDAANWFLSPALDSAAEGDDIAITRTDSAAVGLLSQPLRWGAPSDTPLYLDIMLGNSTGVTKRATIMLAELGGTDAIICPVTVAPNTTPLLHTLKGVTSEDWDAIDVRVFVDDFGDLGLVIDDVAAGASSTAPVDGIDCGRPTATVDENLIVNGDFANGDALWNFFGAIAHEVTDGVLNVRRTDDTSFALVSQVVYTPVQGDTGLELGMMLGNSSDAEKNVTVILSDVDDRSDRIVCPVVVPANTLPALFSITVDTVNNWDRIDVRVFVDDFDEPNLLIDDVQLTASAAPFGAVTCTYTPVPPVVEVAAADGAETPEAPSAAEAITLTPTPTAIPTQTLLPPTATETPQPSATATAILPTATLTPTLTPQGVPAAATTFDVTGAWVQTENGWRIDENASREAGHTLTWAGGVRLDDAQHPILQLRSLRRGDAGTAVVQLSTDAVNWETLGAVGASDAFAVTEFNLSGWRNETVSVRVAWASPAEEDDDGVASWSVGALRVIDVPVTPETVAPETVTPETLTPETVTPEAVTSEPRESATEATPETLTPETVTPETVTPETLTPETLTPETLTPETVTPETITPETEAEEAADGAASVE